MSGKTKSLEKNKYHRGRKPEVWKYLSPRSGNGNPGGDQIRMSPTAGVPDGGGGGSLRKKRGKMRLWQEYVPDAKVAKIGIAKEESAQKTKFRRAVLNVGWKKGRSGAGNGGILIARVKSLGVVRKRCVEDCHEGKCAGRQTKVWRQGTRKAGRTPGKIRRSKTS